MLQALPHAVSGGGLYIAEKQRFLTASHPAIHCHHPELLICCPLVSTVCRDGARQACMTAKYPSVAREATRPVKSIQVIRLSTSEVCCIAITVDPYPGSTRDLALHPEAFGVHNQCGCQSRSTLGLRLSTMWSKVAVCQVSEGGFSPGGLSSACYNQPFHM
jgi:hypothetical protein